VWNEKWVRTGHFCKVELESSRPSHTSTGRKPGKHSSLGGGQKTKQRASVVHGGEGGKRGQEKKSSREGKRSNKPTPGSDLLSERLRAKTKKKHGGAMGRKKIRKACLGAEIEHTPRDSNLKDGWGTEKEKNELSDTIKDG